MVENNDEISKQEEPPLVRVWGDITIDNDSDFRDNN